MYTKADQLAIVASHLWESICKGEMFIGELNIIATNRCNLNCPMCNSGLSRSKVNNEFTLSVFRDYIAKLSRFQIPICTISGGEPTLVPALPDIIEEAVKSFPLEVVLISNFYGDTQTIEAVMESALKNNIYVVCSFDGFGQVADHLRGGKNVAEVVLKHIKMATRMKSLMKSSSTLEIHSVLCDSNVPQMEVILQISKDYGWMHSIAPVNRFHYMRRNRDIPTLTYSAELEEVVNKAIRAENVKQLRPFLKGILDYSRNAHGKYCLYAEDSPINKFKIFLEANGDVSLCDRMSIGNIKEKTIEEIFQGSEYRRYLARNRQCNGCWISCFTEPMLATKPEYSPEVWLRLQSTEPQRR